MDALWTCNTCGKVRTGDPRPSGECFSCHVRGIGFTFVGGGGYGQKRFHEFSAAEELRKTVDGAKARGIDIESASPMYSGPT